MLLYFKKLLALNDVKMATSYFKSNILPFLSSKDKIAHLDDSRSKKDINLTFIKLASIILLFENCEVNFQYFARLARINLDLFSLKALIQVLLKNEVFAPSQFLFELFELFDWFIRNLNENALQYRNDTDKQLLDIFDMLKTFKDPYLTQIFISKFFNSFSHAILPGLAELIRKLGWDTFSQCFASHSKSITEKNVLFLSKLITVRNLF